MKHFVVISSVFVALLGISALDVSAQEFVISGSATVPFGNDGVALDAASFNLGGSTSISDIDLDAKVDLAVAGFIKANLGFSTTMSDVKLSGTGEITADGFSKARLKASTTMDEIDAQAQLDFTADGFAGAKLEFGSQIDAFQVTSEFSLSPEGFESATLSGATRTEEGGVFRGSMTLTPDGITQEVLTMGVQLSGFSLSRTTVLTPAGLASESWRAGATFGKVQLTRNTVYNAAGFVSDTLVTTTKIEDLDIKKTVTFGTSGFAGADIELGGAMSGITFMSETHLAADGTWSESVTLMHAVESVNLALNAQFNPDGFQGGVLNASHSLTLNEEAAEEPAAEDQPEE